MRIIRQLDAVMARYHDSWSIHTDFPPANFQTHEEGRTYNEFIYRNAARERPRFAPA